MDLQDVRKRIDVIDDEIAKLYANRMELALDVAKAKAESGTPVENLERERQILSRVASAMPDEIKLYGKQVFGTMFETSKAYQYSVLNVDSPIKNEIRAAIESGVKPFPIQASIGCQGVEGAYSCIAADKMFEIPSISCFRTWEGVFSAVEHGMCEFGVLPIENSTVGSVIGVYDLMKKHKFHIARSYKLRIKHCLLAKYGVELKDIKEVVSHEQALAQCNGFLKQLGGVKITKCENTGIAAQMIADRERYDVACIASKECASLYGLKILQSDINDSNSNYTRFIAINKQLKVYDGANRISIAANLAHEAGSLNRLLNKFSALGLNLTKIESRPIADSPFEFKFYFDFEADVRDSAVQNLIAEIANKAEDFEFLGAYEEL